MALPVLPLRNLVIYPDMIVPLSVGREMSVAAVDAALATPNRELLTLSQHDPQQEEITASDLYETGCLTVVLKMLKVPDGGMRILARGQSRAGVETFVAHHPFLRARINPLEEPEAPAGDLRAEALIRSARETLDQAATLGAEIPDEAKTAMATVDHPGRLADLIAAHLDLKLPEAQEFLEQLDPTRRLEQVISRLNQEINLLKMQKEINTQVMGEMSKSQREYFLRQQMKAIRDELGEAHPLQDDLADYQKRLQRAKLPPAAQQEVTKELGRLEKTPPESAEAATIRTYLDWMLDLPWHKESRDNLEVAAARGVLDEDHYGLEKIKERILEYLAVRKLKKTHKGPILCFVGPPGVGKTSLGRSIARTLGRKFHRISLGGVHDEAEIRGHRRTYVGAMPGRIIQGVKQVGTRNPVFMLDEVDKIGADFRGDPSSALLEVLDPEQNHTFTDHYLGVPYDLSHVMFIATANLLDPIQPAFRDRMEVIRLTGYTLEEKLEIARRHLIPKLLADHGLQPNQISFSRNALTRIISQYTREAGLRNLERRLAAICRKVAMRVAEKGDRTLRLTPRRVEQFLGVPPILPGEILRQDRVGVATGLAVTQTGGDLLFIEALLPRGKGELTLTGSLGDVMKESALAARSYIRSIAADLGIDPKEFERRDLHVHVPEGAIPKDGPSAGITIATAMASALLQRPMRRDVAMTGEITLRGRVLPVGGIKDKILAARRAGITHVLLSSLNRKDLTEVPRTLQRGLEFHCCETVREVIEQALVPEPSTASKKRRAVPRSGARAVTH